MSRPLADLSPSKQNLKNARPAPIFTDQLCHETPQSPTADFVKPSQAMAAPAVQMYSPQSVSVAEPDMASLYSSPHKSRSPMKYRLQEDDQAMSSPPGSPAEGTVRINNGLTRAMTAMEQEALSTYQVQPSDETTGAIFHDAVGEVSPQATADDTEITFDFGEKTGMEDTVGDLSTISAIPPDLTRFANLRNSPTNTPGGDSWSPSKQLRNSVILNTPGTSQRPLHLLSRSNSAPAPDDDEATPRRRPGSDESPIDLMNFTGQSNILIPPPGSAPRTSRRSPSGRGAFPIRVNPSPHRSQASVDRERASGRSPQKAVPSTPASNRHSMFAVGGSAMDLLDIDLEPMATPRSIPTVTPRELETLRSELQSRISGLEATLSGKEAEVMALKRSITDAEVRAGKISEELRVERVSREELEQSRTEMERRSREMEEVLREVKQNAFVEEREREKLRRQAEEAERQTEEAEVKILELNASLETLRSDRINSSPSLAKHTDPSTPGLSNDIDLAVKNATESVARELHTLYKSKHERKVADLKISYEKRWMKQVEQLKSDLRSSQDEVMRLQTEKEATMSGVIPGQSEAFSRMEGQIEELRRWNDEITAQKKVVEAESVGRNSQIETLLAETEVLRKHLEQERVEKGDLITQIDEFLSLKAEEEEVQQERARTQAALQQPVSPPRSEDGISRSQSYTSGSTASPNKYRNSGNGETAPSGKTGSRPRPMSMLQAPKGGKFSGIPAPGSGLKAPGSNVARAGYGGRSGGLMENLSRMGGR